MGLTRWSTSPATQQAVRASWRRDPKRYARHRLAEQLVDALNDVWAESVNLVWAEPTKSPNAVFIEDPRIVGLTMRDHPRRILVSVEASDPVNTAGHEYYHALGYLDRVPRTPIKSTQWTGCDAKAVAFGNAAAHMMDTGLTPRLAAVRLLARFIVTRETAA